MPQNSKNVQVYLNQFFIKTLTREDRKFYRYRCVFEKEVFSGQEFQKIGNICYKVGVDAVRLDYDLITRFPVREQKIRGEDWRLEDFREVFLNLGDPSERKAIAQLELKNLENVLKEKMSRTLVEPKYGVGLILSKVDTEKHGDGWEVYKASKLDINIDEQGNLFLEIDPFSRFYSPWTFHEWEKRYPNCPIQYVRNTYLDKKGKYITWRYEDKSKENPSSVQIPSLGISLAQYHLNQGATLEEVENSYVVQVKSSGYGKKKHEIISHLSLRLSPVLTMDTLASLTEDKTLSHKQKGDIASVFTGVKKIISERFKVGTELSAGIAKVVYGINLGNDISPLSIQGSTFGKSKLYGKKGIIQKTADVFSSGCIKVGETKFGCLNLLNIPEYPKTVEEELRKVAKNTNVEISLMPSRIKSDFPVGEIDRQRFWESWAELEIKTVLVITHNLLTKSEFQKIRVDALQAGIATQFMQPMLKPDSFRAKNVVLGLLAKAAWQSVRLEPIDHPQAAEMVIGFDTGTNRELYYGTCAFAVLADGQSLGWELPDVQRGETFSGQAVWQTVRRLLLRFNKICGRFPTQILLMRDGFVQEQEFTDTIAYLEEKNIGVDVISVRKSGSGRMGIKNFSEQGLRYHNVQAGTVVMIPEQKSFLLVSIQARMGTARPLRVVHEYGETPLEIIAQQTYNQCQLHPASGYSHARLPWVLHLADKTSKELQRIKQVSILQNLDREKLFSV